MELYIPGVGGGKSISVSSEEGVSPPRTDICVYHAKMVKRLFPFACQETTTKSIKKFFSFSPLLEIIVLQEDLRLLESMKKKDLDAVVGVCRVCGCTELSACPGGCTWADGSRTLCSNCVDREKP